MRCAKRLRDKCGLDLEVLQAFDQCSGRSLSPARRRRLEHRNGSGTEAAEGGCRPCFPASPIGTLPLVCRCAFRSLLHPLAEEGDQHSREASDLLPKAGCSGPRDGSRAPTCSSSCRMRVVTLDCTRLSLAAARTPRPTFTHDSPEDFSELLQIDHSHDENNGSHLFICATSASWPEATHVDSSIIPVWLSNRCDDLLYRGQCARRGDGYRTFRCHADAAADGARNTLQADLGAWLAACNYLGYLAGALVAERVRLPSPAIDGDQPCRNRDRNRRDGVRRRSVGLGCRCASWPE